MIRIGHGYDVHRLVRNRRLILGGVEIDYEMGLEGHSDADVLCHSLMDALLGAAALGDIGTHFPDTDERFAGADSLALLKQTLALLSERGWQVVNVDATVVAQRPRLSEYIQRMREKISEACRLETDCVSVKATTEEGLGFTGAGEGIACHAVCLIQRDA
jgi:2-C-methyl-D-erythritol 2,4-cyclodiphosphate synthase